MCWRYRGIYIYMGVCTDTRICMHVWECVQSVGGSGAGVTCMCVDGHLSMYVLSPKRR